MKIQAWYLKQLCLKFIRNIVTKFQGGNTKYILLKQLQQQL